jgi:hypothetical protein
MTKRFWVSTALTIPVLLLATSDYVPGLQVHISTPLVSWLELIFKEPGTVEMQRILRVRATQKSGKSGGVIHMSISPTAS